MPPSTKSRLAVPPILAAPLEIRNEIYWHAWASPVDDKEHLDRPCTPSYCGMCNFPQTFFKDQFKQLHTLVSVCGQMRDEVLSEYFHRTQVCIGHPSRISNLSTQHRLANYYIRSSLLFTTYTQHVCLAWYPRKDTPDLDKEMWRNILWLTRLKQLKTLELVIIDGTVIRATDDFSTQLYLVLIRGCSAEIIREMEGQLHNLEKVVLKLYFNGRWVHELVDSNCRGRGLSLFQHWKSTLSEMVREDRRQVCFRVVSTLLVSFLLQDEH